MYGSTSQPNGNGNELTLLFVPHPIYENIVIKYRHSAFRFLLVCNGKPRVQQVAMNMLLNVRKADNILST